MALKVRNIKFDTAANVTAHFADGHVVALIDNDTGHSSDESFKTLYLKKDDEVVIHYNPVTLPKSVRKFGLQELADGYTLELFIEYLEATMDAGRKQGGDLGVLTHKLHHDIRSLRLLAKSKK
jgi:hypothetical protein